MPDQLKLLWENLKQITVYQAVVFIVSSISVLTPVYFFAKPIAVAMAGEAMRNLMKQEGIDPEQIKKLPKQVDDAIQGQTRIESDLATVKAQQKQLLDLLQERLNNPQ